MGARGSTVLAGTAVVVLVGGGTFAFVESRRVHGSAQQVSEDYFEAWRNGRLDRMAELAADPPADFADQHRALSQGLLVRSIELTPGQVVSDVARPDDAQRAHLDFEAGRELGGRGTWRYRATLKLGVVDRRWKVLWSPATLHPALRGGPVTWKLTQVEPPGATFTDRAGRRLDEQGPLQPYVAELSERFGGVDEDAASAWAVELTQGGGSAQPAQPVQDGVPPESGPGDKPVQRLALLGGGGDKKIRTTIEPKVQAAAEKALGSDAAGNAAIVAVRPSTGEVLAVADRLGGRGAFLGAYPPGSTFKVVTAAGLLSAGVSPGSSVPCPASVVTAQRTIVNHDGVALGGTSLRDAFAHSCNTTFAQYAVDRLGGDRLAGTARAFGFGGPIAVGPAAVRGAFPVPEGGAELAEASIGQGRVLASPLVMALVAAAVKDGTWRSPRLLDADLIRRSGDQVQSSHPVPNVSALRALMRAVVTDGTAARAGLPGDTAGKTGTAETGDGSADHAWFIGYKGDLAFTVFVENGGSGPKVAAPLAARFLRSL